MSLSDAQIRHAGNPVYLGESGFSEIPVIHLLCEPAEATMTKSQAPESRLKTLSNVTICPINLSYSDAGIWDTCENGTRVWRIGLHVDGALSVSIVFTRYNLSKGVSVYLFDKKYGQVLGAYTHLNNKPYGTFAVAPLYDSTIYIEMQVAPFIDSPGDFEIGYAGIDFNDSNIPGSRNKDEYYGLSGSCNIDINCKEDSAIQLQKHAVVRIVYLGTERCTGTLVNNTRQNGHQYLLTAQHCISSQYVANTCIFSFNYESPVCGGPDGSVEMSVSGASLIATTDNKLDFTLLELSDQPPFYYHPYYSGWDTRNIPPDQSYSIHHPWGDVKKISSEYHPLITGNYGEGYDLNTHWLVRHWEEGTTEKGSSGCGIFNPDNRLIGTLTGGDARCGFSVNDYYQKMYNSWDDYPNPENQLKFWLDPLSSDKESIDGFDPYADFWRSGDTLTNILNTTDVGLIGADMWGHISGHSSDSATTFAEHFITSDSIYLLGVYLNIGLSVPVTISSSVILHIYDGGNLPGDIIYSQEISLTDLVPGNVQFIEFDSVLNVGDDFYAGYEISYENPGETFAVKMSLDGQPENTAFVKYGNTWYALNNFLSSGMNYSFDMRPLVFQTSPNPVRPEIIPPYGDILIGPVPADEMLTIVFWEIPETDFTITFVDLSGRVVMHELISRPDIELVYDLEKIPPGMYIVKMNMNNFNITKKLIILRK